MRVQDYNGMMIEQYLETDDRGCARYARQLGHARL